MYSDDKTLQLISMKFSIFHSSESIAWVYLHIKVSYGNSQHLNLHAFNKSLSNAPYLFQLKDFRIKCKFSHHSKNKLLFSSISRFLIHLLNIFSVCLSFSLFCAHTNILPINVDYSMLMNSLNWAARINKKKSLFVKSLIEKV